MMKKSVLLFVILIGGLIHAQQINLEVKVDGLRNNAGQVKIGLYNAEESFLKVVYKSATAEIKEAAASIVFNDLPKGTYAVSVFHDENSNGTLDKNSFGIPAEGYGTSNNAKGFMGPPKFSDAKFTISNNAKANIKINY